MCLFLVSAVVGFVLNTVIAGPDGSLRGGPVNDRGSAIIYADCALQDARDKRTSGRNDAFADRRVDRYAQALVRA